ncbi:YaaA family protein [Rathayibacter soli]|uniref:YaaA family protein n=1 Tax=Rathayibacter soli TaxID=3144168 RepID=UPI0027E51670|nr:peroxide stress protein YaaA [Glaciibacter superstes]
MLILLPPSETKRDGGTEGSKLDYRQLRYGQLNRLRRTTVRALRELARDREASIAALSLGPTQHGEVEHNRSVTRSRTRPAVDRYTGVLFDALDAQTLPSEARAYLGRNVVVHSALLGPVGALDAIPAYRMSHDSRLPGIRLKSHWAESIASALAAETGLILDARSEAYARLGPAPRRATAAFLRVVTTDGTGRRRALNHFNKHAKGALVRVLAQAGVEFESVEHLVACAAQHGFRLEPGVGKGPGELDELCLIV